MMERKARRDRRAEFLYKDFSACSAVSAFDLHPEALGFHYNAVGSTSDGAWNLTPCGVGIGVGSGLRYGSPP